MVELDSRSSADWSVGVVIYDKAETLKSKPRKGKRPIRLAAGSRTNTVRAI